MNERDEGHMAAFRAVSERIDAEYDSAMGAAWVAHRTARRAAKASHAAAIQRAWEAVLAERRKTPPDDD